MRFFIAVLCFSFAINLSAQERRNKGNSDRMESMKIAFITQELNLSPEESQVFWPEYNIYEKELKALKKEFRQDEGFLDDISEADAGKLIDQKLDFEEKKLQLRRQFISNIDGKLTKKKIVKLMQVEEKFKRELLRRVRNKIEQKEQRKLENKRN